MLYIECIGIAGVLCGGLKLFRENQRKKRVHQFLRTKKRVDHASTELLQETFFVTTQYTRNKAKDAIDHELNVVLGSLGLSTITSLIYPPLGIISLFGVFYTCRHFYTNSYRSIVKNSKFNTDVIFAILLIYFLVMGYCFVGSLYAVILTVNRKLVAKIKDDSKKTIINIFREQPRSLWLYTNGVEVNHPIEAVKQDDIIVIHAGETIPVDGRVTEGIASVDQHILTGESQPVDKSIGDPVFALTIVQSGCLYVQVEKTGEETTAAHIGHILNRTIDSKTNMQLQAEVIGDRTALPTLLLSGLTFPILGLQSSIVVLNSHSGKRLSVAASIGILNFFKLASRKGILIKDGRHLEALSTVDTIVFDKTGTLTQEQPSVGWIYTSNGYEENEILRYAAAAEDKQTHPIACAIVHEATLRPEVKTVIRDLRQHHVKEMYIISGDHEAPMKQLAEELGIDHYFAETLPEDKATLIKQLQQEGKSVCFVGDGINDAIALKEARVSVSLRGASTVATDTADVILMDQSLSQLCSLLDVAQAYAIHMKGLARVVVIPSLINLVGALFFHLGLLPSVMIVLLGMSASMTKAMWPLIQDSSFFHDFNSSGHRLSATSRPTGDLNHDQGHSAHSM